LAPVRDTRLIEGCTLLEDEDQIDFWAASARRQVPTTSSFRHRGNKSKIHNTFCGVCGALAS